MQTNAEPCLGVILKLMRKATIEKFIGPDSKAQFLGFASDEQKGKTREDHPIMNETFNFFFFIFKKIYLL